MYEDVAIVVEVSILQKIELVYTHNYRLELVYFIDIVDIPITQNSVEPAIKEIIL